MAFNINLIQLWRVDSGSTGTSSSHPQHLITHSTNYTSIKSAVIHRVGCTQSTSPWDKISLNLYLNQDELTGDARHSRIYKVEYTPLLSNSAVQCTNDVQNKYKFLTILLCSSHSRPPSAIRPHERLKSETSKHLADRKHCIKNLLSHILVCRTAVHFYSSLVF